MGKKDVNEFTDKQTGRREDAVLKRVLSTPPKHKTAKDDKANPPKKRGHTTSISRGEISRGEQKRSIQYLIARLYQLALTSCLSLQTPPHSPDRRYARRKDALPAAHSHALDRREMPQRQQDAWIRRRMSGAAP